MIKESADHFPSAPHLARELLGLSERKLNPLMSQDPEIFTQSLHALVALHKAPINELKNHPGWLRFFLQPKIRSEIDTKNAPMAPVTEAPLPRITWRQRLACPLGQVFLNDYFALEELDGSGIFAPFYCQVALALWKRLPGSSQLFHTLDALVGFVLTSQIALRLSAVDHSATAGVLPWDYPKSPRLSDWQRFVLRHTKLQNFWFHFVSMLFFFGSPLIAIATQNPLWLAFFFSSGLIGTAGHYFAKDGGVSVKEATIQLMVPVFVLRMFYLLACGRYADEIKKAHTAFEGGVGLT